MFAAIAPVVEEDPCDPNPCGPYSAPPRSRGGRCDCSCLPEMIGSPPNCHPECVLNADCPKDRACVNQKCVDPCPGVCGQNAHCKVRNHYPLCVCDRGFVGDPFTRCYKEISKQALLRKLLKLYFFSATREPEIIQPCNPSPCGVNAECREQNNAAACSCIRDYQGNPYIECKPECVSNSDCARHLVCLNQKCVDPCKGLCGDRATCSVNNHIPLCTCYPGFTGDAFVACRRITTCESSVVNTLY